MVSARRIAEGPEMRVVPRPTGGSAVSLGIAWRSKSNAGDDGRISIEALRIASRALKWTIRTSRVMSNIEEGKSSAKGPSLENNDLIATARHFRAFSSIVECGFPNRLLKT